MAMNCSQICAMARQIAKCPNFTSQSGMFLNAVLANLARDYDFDIQKVTSFILTTGGVTPAQGPYPLPANYLRAAINEVGFVILGQPITMIQMDLAKIQALFVGQGINNYPEFFATDFSTLKTLGYPTAYLWAPATGVYAINWHYFKEHTEIVTPETDTTTPWFPDSVFLYTAVAGELMKITDDEREDDFNDPDEGKVAKLLRKYLEMKDDKDGYAVTVQLDRNNFPAKGTLPPTKVTVF